MESFGVELEYMIVDQDTLQVVPMADELLTSNDGTIHNEVDHGEITLSNELVSHVVELKTTQPTPLPSRMGGSFVDLLTELNRTLSSKAAMILPGAMHPFMNPRTETHLWPYGQHEIYERFHKLFDCHRHGWANLQSMHINLPFQTDEEFALLHSAIRVILPILPGIAASSPVMDGAITEYRDARLFVYTNNAATRPVIAGDVVPDAIFSEAEYREKILDPIDRELITMGADDVLEAIWVNSRGAMARFDRGSIEIRLIDVQENPRQDLAIADLVCATIRWLIEERDLNQFANIATAELVRELQNSTMDGEDAIITSQALLALFGFRYPVPVRELWRRVLDEELLPRQWISPASARRIGFILEWGTLASRILRALSFYGFLSGPVDRDVLRRVYRGVAESLKSDGIFNGEMSVSLLDSGRE